MFINPLFKLNIVNQRGISLIELIMFIVIVSTALIGILSVMNTVAKSSADPMMHKQTLAIAESLLEEIEAQDVNPESGVPSTNLVSASNRNIEYHVITDYNGFTMSSASGISTFNGAILSNYSVSVLAASPVTIGSPAASAVRITVTVTPPNGDAISVMGYRTAY